MNISGNSRSSNTIVNKANLSDFEGVFWRSRNSPKNYFSDTNWTEMLRNSSVCAISRIGFSNSAFTKNSTDCSIHSRTFWMLLQNLWVPYDIFQISCSLQSENWTTALCPFSCCYRLQPESNEISV
ncbi:hypothetical protein CEXT_633211 [Caerostris extrusa]|uniref:Uncharacterized protein n=1 Tax=Caerostris extrusa TaxID=172846 RepID=A0AAV4MX02_CAEEX|nr:hypothetical protein CEXT_633211 [Caerostris extrusa]